MDDLKSLANIFWHVILVACAFSFFCALGYAGIAHIFRNGQNHDRPF